MILKKYRAFPLFFLPQRHSHPKVRGADESEYSSSWSAKLARRVLLNTTSTAEWSSVKPWRSALCAGGFVPSEMGRGRVRRSRSQGASPEPGSLPEEVEETRRYANGDLYVGSISRQGLRDGRGTYIFRNGDRYAGHWRGNEFSGFGTFQWREGDVYEGQWERGLPHGFGVKTMHDGSAVRGCGLCT